MVEGNGDDPVICIVEQLPRYISSRKFEPFTSLGRGQHLPPAGNIFAGQLLPCTCASHAKSCAFDLSVPKTKKPPRRAAFFETSFERLLMLLVRFGGDLLSHVLRRSTIGAAALNGRVRDGIGCFACAMTTKPKEQHLGSASSASRTRYTRVIKDDVSKSYASVYAFEPVFYWIKSSLSDN